MVAELGLDGTDDLTLLGPEGSLLELGYGLALTEATEVPAILGAARVLGVLLCELREIPAVLQLLLYVLGLLFLVFVEEDMPYATLLGGRELGLFVLLVVILDLFVGGLCAAGHPFLYLLDREVLADILAELVLRDVVLLQGLLVGLGYLDADELGQDLLHGGLILGIVSGHASVQTALLGELIQFPLRDVSALEGHYFPGLGVDIGDRLGRSAAHHDEYGDPQ